MSWSRRNVHDKILRFVAVMPGYYGLSRTEQLRKARRWGLRAVKVRVELVA